MGEVRVSPPEVNPLWLEDPSLRPQSLRSFSGSSPSADRMMSTDRRENPHFQDVCLGEAAQPPGESVMMTRASLGLWED